jgi:MFS family permease
VKHGREVLFAIAGINLIGFMTICLCVKEGDYPPVVEPAAGAESQSGIRDFLRTSFRHPIYRWVYLTRVLLFAANATTPFILFFAADELHMTFEEAGKYLGYASLPWIVIAYPVGRILDRYGSVRSLVFTLSLGSVCYLLSFFLIRGPTTFLLVALVNITLFWATWSNETMLAQQVFDRRRMGQLGAANSIVKSVLIAFGTSPFIGAYLDRVSGYSGVVHVPFTGDLAVGGFRYLYLILALAYFLALLAILQVRRLWVELGGPDHYRPPADGPLEAD